MDAFYSDLGRTHQHNAITGMNGCTFANPPPSVPCNYAAGHTFSVHLIGRGRTHLSFLDLWLGSQPAYVLAVSRTLYAALLVTGAAIPMTNTVAVMMDIKHSSGIANSSGLVLPSWIDIARLLRHSICTTMAYTLFLERPLTASAHRLVNRIPLLRAYIAACTLLT
ncbi:hypothetical protein K474DRAFT_961053 [Panus rudis PR-1116 ss-1]|nr:hypothetical protein K474DRAFT_961053 [Panus rudis PR-1116 ss-1]